MILLDDVHLTLGSDAGAVNILRGLSLSVADGETVSITGPSGSGKSTMMMIIAGLERQSSGLVEVAGHELEGMDEDALALFRRDHVGIVFQAFHLVPTMTALENVALPLEFAGASNAFEIAGALLEEVGLTPRVDHFPAQLSGGEQQRVAIARALSRQPKLILADEPTGNLDSQTGKHIVDLLFGLQRRRNATLMLVTHDQRVAAACARTIHMADGRINTAAEARAAS